MKIIVDSVGLSDQADAGRLERWLLEATATDDEVIVLDRGKDLAFERCRTFPFPSYERDRVNAADSQMLQRYCDKLEANVFVTTGWTTPMTTPAIMLVSDRSSKGSTLRESDERRLCGKYCHAIVRLFGRMRGPLDAAFDRHKVAPSIKAALARPFYSRAFYDEWARLRRLQDKLDVRLWSEHPL